MNAKVIGTIGLALAGVGTVMLFLFGIPFANRTRGVIYRSITQTDPEAIQREKRADILGWGGLLVGAIGVFCQIAAIWMA